MYSFSFRYLKVKYKNFDEWFNYFCSSKKYKATYKGNNLRLLRVKFAISLLKELYYLNDIKKIHVTGSSGKSSCAKIWGEFLFQQGFSVGVITKPHLCNFNERYWCNGKLATEENLMPLFERVMDISEKVSKQSEYGSLRYVEIMFLVGLLYFVNLKLDYIVIEAGIGALYDYTNVFPDWEIGVITSIHNEHKRRLGGSIDSIIHHKVDVINKSKRAYFLERSKSVQEKIKLKITNEVKTFFIDKDFEIIRYNDGKSNAIVKVNSKTISLKTNIISRIQLINLVSVVHYVDSIQKITQPINYKFNILGKFDTRIVDGRIFVFDTAHTPESVADVVDTLNIQYPNTDKYVFLAVTGRRKGKRMIELIRSNVKKIYTVKLKIEGVPFNYYSDFGKQSYSNNSVQEIKYSEIKEGIGKLPKDSIVVFTGSVYYVGHAMKTFSCLM